MHWVKTAQNNIDAQVEFVTIEQQRLPVEFLDDHFLIAMALGQVLALLHQVDLVNAGFSRSGKEECI